MSPLARPNPIARLKTSSASYVVVSATCALLALLGILAAGRAPGVWWIVAAVGGLGAFLLLWLHGFALTLTETAVCYKTLLRGTACLPVEQVKDVRVETSRRSYGDKVKPTVRVVIEPLSPSRLPALVVNAKVFDTKQLKDFLELLEAGTKRRQA